MFPTGDRQGGKDSPGNSDGERKSSAISFFPRSEDIAIPALPVIDQLVDIVQENHLVDFSKIVFVGTQHILNTTATLFKALIQLGAKPEQMYFTGKCYSTCAPVAAAIRKMGIWLIDGEFPEKSGEYLKACKKGTRQLWSQVIEDLQTKHKEADTIIILDEGGHCLEEIPYQIKFNYKIAGIEQTRNGLYRKVLALLPFPVVTVASSASKRILEPPLIAEAASVHIKKLVTSCEIQNGSVFGVIGCGAIGRAIIKLLLQSGMRVLVYDQDESVFHNFGEQIACFRMPNVSAVIANAQYIIGCTGQDVTAEIGDIFEIIQQDKIFISCSSEDKEFLTLLKKISSLEQRQSHPLSNIDYKPSPFVRIQILRGGFPVNFDQSSQSVVPQKIQLTRGLLLGACLQASVVAKKPTEDGVTVNGSELLSLDPSFQRLVVQLWQNADNPVIEEHVNFENVSWIAEHSGGQSITVPRLSECFDQCFTEQRNSSPVLKFGTH